MKSDTDLLSRVLASPAVRGAGDGVIQMPVGGLMVMLHRGPTAFTPTMYNPVLCVVLQGEKETRLAGQTVRLAAGDSVVVSHEIPVTVSVTRASRAAAYVAVILPLDLGIIRSLHADLFPGDRAEHDARALQSGSHDGAVTDAIGRLFELVETPTEARVLAPLIVREIHCRVLLGAQGGMLRVMLDPNSHASKISRAINKITAARGAALTIRSLAREASMSESSFHQHFKRITGTTPLRYQKDVRLIEARGILRSGSESVSEVAFRVGYESASQFSREYSRKFGVSPRDDRGHRPG